MTDESAAFGSRLRAYRRMAGLSQEELAARSGLSLRAIGNLERGSTRRPHPGSVDRLADALGLPDEVRRGLIAAARQRAADDGPAGPVTGAPEPPAAPGGGRIVPRQLPAAVRQFVSRRGELAALNRLLDQAERTADAVVIAALQGTAGVGKTALALHWAHRVAGRFPDGQLYLDLRGFAPSGPMPPAEALRGLLDALGVPAAQIPASIDAQSGLYRSLLSDRRVLVVLDNARDSSQVRPLLPGSPGNLVIVTSRSQLGGLVAVEGAWSITLDLFDAGDSRELLASRLGPERLTPEPDAVAELIALCAGLPLALTIAAARVSARPRLRLGEFTGELRDTRRTFDALDGRDGPASVRAVFSWSMTRLSAPAARLFGLLGIHPGPDIGVPAAASLAGLPPRRARRILDELADAHLITEHAAGRFALHDLLRAYAAGQAAADEAACRAALGRVLDHYVQTASAATVLLKPTPAPFTLEPPPPGISPERITGLQHALDWFGAEHEVLISAVELAARTGFDTRCWQLAWAIGDFLVRSGHWHRCAAIQRIALAAATRSGDLAGQAAARRHIAWACLRLTDYAEASSQFTACLELNRRMGDRAGEARAHQALSSVSASQGRNADSLSHAEQALVLFEAIGDLTGQAGALNDVGWCHALLGDYQQARMFCRQALALNRELGIRPGEAVVWDSLGSIEQRVGRPAEAATCYRAAIALFAELGARFFEADTLIRLGEVLDAAGDAREAHESWQRSLEILDSMSHPSAAQVRVKLQQPGAGAGRPGSAYRAGGSASRSATKMPGK